MGESTQLRNYAGNAKKTSAGYYSNTLVIILNSVVISAGTVYIILQWHFKGKIVDSIFVSMLTGATMILMMGLRVIREYLLDRGLEFYMFTMPKDEPDAGFKEYTQLCDSIFNFRNMTVSGIIYGVIVGSTPFILNVWDDNIWLKVSLALLMFFVNFVTGVGFYALVTCFWHFIKMGRLVRIDLWQAENPSTEFLLGASRRIAVFASLYISICISSILFSKIPLVHLVIGYSLFSALIILLVVAIPAYPIARKMREAKIKATQDIGEQLQQCYCETLKMFKSGNNEVNFSKFESLLQLRDKITAINSWPFKMKSITAGFSVIFFSSIPIVLQVVLERMLE